MSSFDDDIKDMRKQVMEEVLLHIEVTPELYEELEGKQGEYVKAAVYNYSGEHDNEFGSVFEAELDVLKKKDWKEIAERI